MVESAPLFIEYCCQGYVNMDAVKALIVFAALIIGFSVISIFGGALLFLKKRILEHEKQS